MRAGKLVLEETVFDLHELVAAVCELWRSATEASGLAFSCDIDASVPRWVMGDPTRLRQVLLNHVSNAVKFTEHGKVTVTVQPAVGVDEAVLFSIRDTGIGLTAEQRDRLFKPFSQADVSTTRRFGGTGLGLSISSQLTRLMGGHVQVESTAGLGSEFQVVIPLHTASEPERAEDGPEVDLTALRILVAEDNPINQAVIRLLLSTTDAIVDVTSNGREALEHLRAADYDIVLMDIHMPELDGIEALRCIRAGEAGRRDQPVIALTADAMAGNEQRFLAMGFDAVEPKPIRPATLFAAIGEVHAAANVIHDRELTG